MSLFQKVEAFVQAHYSCGELTWTAPPPTPKGYQVRVACPCGAVFEWWVTMEMAELDLLYSRLGAFQN